jgi:hypothetical protein
MMGSHPDKSCLRGKLELPHINGWESIGRDGATPSPKPDTNQTNGQNASTPKGY